ncbi:snRNA-activating protein complex subunit 2-like [Mus caroli]|uniref:snRNA-activating protein complex subunit 2-like n=1 Tax=Mus caroli TaxID=10089 RepID=A0A6P5R701_MUSCR|nr:snRNA-activating protein complex subunit 2-like [Mus caroli]
MALLVLLATEPEKPIPEFTYIAEDLALISKDPRHQFNKNKRLWYTSREKKILPQRQAEAMIKQMQQWTHLGKASWNLEEKRELVRLLQARRGQPEPDAAELAQELQGRCKAEICHFIQKLKDWEVQEAIQKMQPGGREGPRHQETQLPASVEVWMDLAEKLTGPLEEALTAAFSQVLTIAAAEPLSLLHSRPGKPTKARGKALVFLSNQDGQKDPASEGSGANPETSGLASEVTVPDPDAPTKSLAGSSTDRDFAVDFEKIYKYLSFSSRGGHGPELSAAESAGVLNLLMALPEELSHLPCTALLEHMTKTYAQLMAPQTSLPGEKRPRPGTEDGGTGSTGPEEPDRASPQASEPIEPRLAWKAVGICPLNPFLVPLGLVSQVPSPSR